MIDATNPARSPEWTFLSNHTHVLFCISLSPDIRIRDIAVQVGITERAVQRIVVELEQGGYIKRERVGRQKPLPPRTNSAFAPPFGTARRGRRAAGNLAAGRCQANFARHRTPPWQGDALPKEPEKGSQADRQEIGLTAHAKPRSSRRQFSSALASAGRSSPPSPITFPPCRKSHFLPVTDPEFYAELGRGLWWPRKNTWFSLKNERIGWMMKRVLTTMAAGDFPDGDG